MKNSPRALLRSWPSLLVAIVAAATAIESSIAQTTGWNQTAAGTYDYTDTNNWVDGTINGLWDSSLTLSGHQTATFGADTALGTGLTFDYNGGFNVTFTGTGGARTLTLGGDIVVNTVSNTRTITFGSSTASQNLNIDLGGVNRNFTVGSGRTLGFVNVISNGGITASGGTINFSGANTYSGDTILNSGVIGLNGAAGSAANSNFFLNGGTGTPTLQFNSNSSGNTGTTRANSVTLNGAGSSNGVVLAVTGNAGANSNDVITGTLTAVEGFAVVSVASNAARNAGLTAAALDRQAGSTLLLRGTNLGTNAIGSGTSSANIVFTTAPTLSGTGALGTTTAGIIHGAYGDATSSGDGRNGGLVTYDPANGVRLLTGSEYTAGIVDSQTQLDNVRYERASGGASQDINLTSGTTSINSLSFKITGSGSNSGVTISGDAGAVLKLNSGVIFASQQVSTANATDAMIISAPTLDLNGNEGVILAFTNGVSNGNTVAPLNISSEITNDGGNGVTIGGTGQVIFSGSVASSYTGPTTLNSGILRLNKSVTNIGLTTDLIMNGGTLLKNTNAIADTASVTINGGSFVMDSTTSSGNNGHSETVNNFTMNGGSFSNHGSNAFLGVNGNLNINASQIGMNQGGDITVLGNTALNGGLLLARESSSAVTSNGLTTLNTVSITNQASGAYTAITLNSHATNMGALLTLNGDLTFTGTSSNSNTVTIASSDTGLANQGVIALSGNRTFNIGNGAAQVDLTIVPALVDATAGDGLVKAGLGTLLLGGTNTFTGTTTVNAGTLLINGSSVSETTVIAGILGGDGVITNSVSIGDGGTLAPGNSPGMLSTGDLSLTGTTSTIAMEISGTGAGEYDQVNVTGGVSLDGNGQIEVTMLSFVPQPTDIYFLILNDDVDAISGTLFNLAQGSTFDSGGYTWQVSYTGDSTGGTFTGGNDLALQVVPEPSTWVLLTGGLMAATLLRRRRA